MADIDDCHFGSQAVKELALGQWNKLETLIICNDMIRKIIMKNLEIKAVVNWLT